MTSTKSSKTSQYDYMNEFNSDSDEEGTTDAQKSSREDFASMLNDSFKSAGKKLRVGDKIRGEILVLGSTDVFVSTGTQHDGIVQKLELLDAEGNCPYKVGDIAEFYVTLVKHDEVRLSKNPTSRNLADDIKGAYENRQPIQGRIVEACKGGVRVNIKGKLAFCPISQIDSKHIETVDEYVGKSFDFQITQITEGGKNIVVSRRKLLDAEKEVGMTHFLAEKKDGDVITGRVTRFETFGAFVELAPGLDGLVHISEIAWSRIGSPSEVLTIGQEVTVKILKREIVNGKPKISLSIKQAAPREETLKSPSTPTEGTQKIGAPLGKDDLWGKLSVGQNFTGKVTRKEHYGLFVQLEPGITGLLHKSRTEAVHGFQFEKIKVNDPLTVAISEIRLSERQISLSLPGAETDSDWKKDYQPDTKTSFGTLGDSMRAALLKKK